MKNSLKALVTICLWLAVIIGSAFLYYVNDANKELEAEKAQLMKVADRLSGELSVKKASQPQGSQAGWQVADDQYKKARNQSQFEGIVLLAQLASEPDKYADLLKFIQQMDPKESECLRRKIVHFEKVEYLCFGESTFLSNGGVRHEFTKDNAFLLVRPNTLEVIDFKVGGRGQIWFQEIGGKEESILIWYGPEGSEARYRITANGFKPIESGKE